MYVVFPVCHVFVIAPDDQGCQHPHGLIAHYGILNKEFLKHEMRTLFMPV